MDVMVGIPTLMRTLTARGVEELDGYVAAVLCLVGLAVHVHDGRVLASISRKGLPMRR